MKASAFNGDIEIFSTISLANDRLLTLFSATSMPTIKHLRHQTPPN